MDNSLLFVVTAFRFLALAAFGAGATYLMMKRETDAREWFPYARCFYAPDGSKQYKEDASFTLAWNLHQKRNKHHWQWWVIMFDRGEFETIPMPDIYRREMLADWRGAGRAITGEDNTLSWYIDNFYKIRLHDETRAWIDHELTGLDLPLEVIAQSNNVSVHHLKNDFLADAARLGR